MVFHDAMDSLDEGILILDEKADVFYVNPFYVQMFQLRSPEDVEDHCHLIILKVKEARKVDGQVSDEKKELVTDVHLQWQGSEMFLNLRMKRFITDDGKFELIRVVDVTEEAQREKRLEYMIEEMTANVVSIAKGFAILPLQPILKEGQGSILLNRVPVQCQEQSVTRLVIQFSSITDIDQELAWLMTNLISSLKLLGVEVAIAGLRPQVVLQFTHNGIKLEGVRTFMNIQQATKHFLKEGFRPTF